MGCPNFHGRGDVFAISWKTEDSVGCLLVMIAINFQPFLCSISLFVEYIFAYLTSYFGSSLVIRFNVSWYVPHIQSVVFLKWLPDQMSRTLAAILGGAAGAVALVGIVVLLLRFWLVRNRSISRTSETGSSDPSVQGDNLSCIDQTINISASHIGHIFFINGFDDLQL